MQKIGYIFFRLLILILRVIPFGILYFLSRILAVKMFYIIRYRRRIVFQNLRNSFPNKSEKEIRLIAKKFYLHLCDVALESLKGFTCPVEKLVERYKLLNPNIYTDYFEKGINVIGAAGHYCNWEWGNQTASKLLLHEPIGLYKPLSNIYIDEFIRKTRNRTGTHLFSINLTKKAFVTDYGKPYTVMMVADQKPFKRSQSLWINFLNQKTACLPGVEGYAKIFNLPIVYFKTVKVRRGYYTIELIPICDNPRELPKGEITKRYMNLLEQSILEAPEYYLWSHRRWKLEYKDEEIY